VKVTVSLQGLRELDARLGALKRSTAKGVLRRVGKAALQPFDEAWRKAAPHLSGQLAASGSVGSKLTRTQRRDHERESFVEVFAGPGALPQAIVQEFGSATNRPQPFVRPAWDATKDQVLANVKTLLGDEIDKTARRAAARAAKRTAKAT